MHKWLNSMIKPFRMESGALGWTKRIVYLVGVHIGWACWGALGAIPGYLLVFGHPRLPSLENFTFINFNDSHEQVFICITGMEGTRRNGNVYSTSHAMTTMCTSAPPGKYA